MTLQMHEQLRQLRPQCKIADIGTPAMRLRMIKSDEEIAHIRHGAQVCDIGGAALRAAVCSAEYETQAMVREIAKRFPDGELQSGINTDGAHNPTTVRRCNNPCSSNSAFISRAISQHLAPGFITAPHSPANISLTHHRRYQKIKSAPMQCNNRLSWKNNSTIKYRAHAAKFDCVRRPC